MNEPEDVTPSHGTTSRLFHWTVALLVLIQIPVGIAMTSAPLAGIADPLIVLHKGLGGVLLVVVLARVAWRVVQRPPAFPPYMPAREQHIAHRTHLALYGLLVVMVVSGYVRTVGDGYPIEMFDALGIPALVPSMPRVAAVMLVVHRFTSFALVALVAIHVSMVLKHQIVDRNPALKRMWPPVCRR